MTKSTTKASTKSNNNSPIHIAKPIIGIEEKQAVLKVLDSGILASGQQVTQFENNFKTYITANHAIATSNGTTALHAALKAHGITKEDEVITSPFSFVATANAIRYVGASPVFADINPKTFNIDPNQIKNKITSKTKAILVVHLFGNPCNMQEIEKIAKRHNLTIIEDACQAHGASINQKKIGSTHTACFSFYPTKNMTTAEGGIITTNKQEIADKLRLIVSHGSKKRYHHSHYGHNFRMTNIAAAIGIEQLKKLDKFNQKRKDNATFITNNLKNLKHITLPNIHNGHAIHQYTISIPTSNPQNKQRNHLKDYLKQHNIGSEIYYPIPIHKQKIYKRHNNEIHINTEKASKEVLSIPIHPSLSKSDLKRISDTITTWDQI